MIRTWTRSLFNWVQFTGPYSVPAVADLDPSGTFTLEGDVLVYTRDERLVRILPGQWVAWAYCEKTGGFLMAFSDWSEAMYNFKQEEKKQWL